MEKKFIRVDEVAKELEISESHAYKIMCQWSRKKSNGQDDAKTRPWSGR